ncbi:hypothetical protein [Leptospira idonii]|uniref:hypothetical protein n=1 Tax=Leptospira idonii TaxID=1193500 RepID=UPI001FE523B8|nr:hypothetical protein [Leptospira idonii]
MSQNLKMGGVRVWDHEKRQFGEVSDLEVAQGKIKSIKASPRVSGGEVRYLLPGFCDASVNLGSNSFGGGTTKDNLSVYLQSFISTGFSHVESVGDPDLTRVREEITKGKWVGPILLQSQKPILLSSHVSEPPGPTKQYQMVGLEDAKISISETKEQRTRHLPVFLKKKDGLSFPQTNLFQWRKDWEGKNYIPIIYSFSEELAWQDALDTGYLVIFQPMPPHSRLSSIQTRSFQWAPILNVAYFQSMKENPVLLKERIREIAQLHPVFREQLMDGFLSTLPEVGDPTISQESFQDFQGIWKTFKEHPNLKQKLIFASGSGHWGAFPGVAAIQEAYLWEEAWKETRGDFVVPTSEPETSFWKKLFSFSPKEKVLLPTHSDQESIPENRIDLLQILTEKTCGFIGADHEGKIKTGGPAHFSVFKENPLKRTSGIFAIESMVLGGKLVYTPKPQKVGKKP